MSEAKLENPPDVVQEAPLLTPSSDEADGASASTSPVSSPTAGKSDNYFSRKFGSILNRSKRKFKKNGSQDTVDIEHQNGHDNGEKSPTQKSPQKSPRTPQKSPKTPKTPQTPDNRQSKFQKLFRSSKRSKSADMVEDEAASTSQIGTGDISISPKEKHANFTKYGQQRQIVVDGKALKEIEVTGEKQQESMPEKPRHRRISKSRRKSEFEGDELKVQCRDLAPADYEGWLFKKSGGTGLTPVVWKQCWVVLKNGILYLFKTSFDIAAQHAYSVRNFSVAPIEEKRKFTFKLFPKNVPPEALHDAKGVVFSSESDADVEKWCDVLNKAALGFIIQPATPAEQVEPVRRRCQSSAVRKNKSSVLGVSSHENGHRIRSSTLTGETTGLPSTFTRTSSTSRVRKVSQSGSSSVLAVGTMFRVIDDPEDKVETTNGDLSSILYKEKQLGDESEVTETSQRSPLNGPTEEEVRMQVKKEVERINKQAKPVKVVEGSTGPTASTKKADIIRLEIQNLKESQRLIDDEGADTNDTDVQMRDVAREEDASERLETAADNDDGQLCEDSSKEEGDIMAVATAGPPEGNAQESEDASVAGSSLEDTGKDGSMETGDISMEETSAAAGVSLAEDVSEQVEDIEVPSAAVDKIVNVQIASGADEETDNERSVTASSETSPEETTGAQDKDSGVGTVEESDDSAGVTVEEYLQGMESNGKDLPEEEEEEEEGMSVEEYLKTVEQAGEASIEDYLKSCEESGDKSLEKHGLEDHSDSEDDETEDIEPRIESVSHASMIPAKQQRMLIDAVASLDYPSDTESESDADEICHYAKIERPSANDADEEASDKEKGDLDIVLGAPPEFQDDDAKHHSLTRVRDHNVQYGATEEGKFVVHHTYIKDSAPEETDASSDQISTTGAATTVDANGDAKERPLDPEDPFTVYCEDHDTATEHVLPITSSDELANFEERLNKLIEEEDKMLSELEKNEDGKGSDHVDSVKEHQADEVVEPKQYSGTEEETQVENKTCNQTSKSADETDQSATTATKDLADQTEGRASDDEGKPTAEVEATAKENASIKGGATTTVESSNKEETQGLDDVQISDKDIDNNNIDEKSLSPTTKTIKIVQVAVKDNNVETVEERHESAV